MHALVLLPEVLPETHDRLVVRLRQRETVFAHERAKNAIDLTKCEAEMFGRRELEKHVMHKRCVDIARCIGCADPHSQNFTLRAAPVPSVAL